MGYDPNQPYGQGQPPNPYGQPPTQYNPPPTGYEQPPPYGQPPMYGGVPPVPPMPNYGPPPQKKSSLRGLWITLAIVGGLLVLACGGCVIASVAGIGFFAKSIAGPTATATVYYQNIKDQNYDQAYNYLDTNMTTTQGQPLTSTVFTQLAQAQDSDKGQVTNFSQTSVNTDSTNGVNTATVIMSVTRNGSSYDVTLQLKQEDGAWKIIGFDNI